MNTPSRSSEINYALKHPPLVEGKSKRWGNWLLPVAIIPVLVAVSVLLLMGYDHQGSSRNLPATEPPQQPASIAPRLEQVPNSVQSPVSKPVAHAAHGPLLLSTTRGRTPRRFEGFLREPSSSPVVEAVDLLPENAPPTAYTAAVAPPPPMVSISGPYEAFAKRNRALRSDVTGTLSFYATEVLWRSAKEEMSIRSVKAKCQPELSQCWLFGSGATSGTFVVNFDADNWRWMQSLPAVEDGPEPPYQGKWTIRFKQLKSN